MRRGRAQPAIASLASAIAWFSVRYAHDAEMECGKRAEEAAHHALEKDPALADAHLATASAAGTTYRGFDWNTVLERTSTALALDPSLEVGMPGRVCHMTHERKTVGGPPSFIL